MSCLVELVSPWCGYLNAGAAALDGEAGRLALRQAAFQRWWRFWLAAWVATGGAMGVLGVVISAVAAPGSRFGELEWVATFPLSGCFGDPQVVWVRFRVKAPHFSAGGDDAYGRRILLGGAVVVHSLCRGSG